MIVAPSRPTDDHPRRRLATVDKLCAEYQTSKSTMYDFLRRNPNAGVLRIGKKILVDVDIFDDFVSRPQ